ncbi:MAG: hypothetical protein ACKOWG_14415, partial [Planctomycetia bacterium]
MTAEATARVTALSEAGKRVAWLTSRT